MGRDDWDEGIVFEDAPGPRTRPFVVTGGKTSANASVRIETLIETSTQDVSVRFEKADVLNLIGSESMSVAEVSAHLNLPIGTTVTLIGDMIDDGILTAHATIETEQGSTATNIDIMSRIIKRVQEL